MSFYNRVRDHYLALAEAEPERFSVIDASQALDAVQAQIGTAVDRLIDTVNNIRT